MKPAIYELRIAHKSYGPNFSFRQVIARTALEAIRRAKLTSREILEEVRIVARLD